MKCWAIIVAAGKGERAGFGKNKVYTPLGGGMTVLETTLKAFDESGLFDGITVVISPNDKACFDSLSIPKSVLRVVNGGENRQKSVYNGLKSVSDDVEIVAIHDAARPFITRDVIYTTLKSAQEFGSGVISTPITDTIKQVGNGGEVITLDRNSLFAVQTPQSFKRGLIVEAHRVAFEEGYVATDDAALYERAYGSVRLVTSPGAVYNRKLTFKKDFEYTNMNDARVGHGYDAHRLVEGRRLVLCGVCIPYEKGLDGHSDADVALHALMDAMLGAAGLGDIGRHFPDSDDKYLGVSSMKLLEETVGILADAGYRVTNADVTIIAQKPKLASRMDEMRSNVSRVLGIAETRVNIKATTTEHMGFEGAGEGISAHAVVMIGGIV